MIAIKIIETITDSYEITDQEGAVPVCKENQAIVDCSELEKYDELIADIDKRMQRN